MNHQTQTPPTAFDVLFPDHEDDTQTAPFDDLIEEEIQPDDPVIVADDLQADIQLMRLQNLQSRMDEIDDLFQKELDHLKQWKERRLEVLQNRYDFFSHSLENWLSANQEKSVNLPHGVVAFRKQPVRVEILDEDTVITQTPFIRIRKSPDKSAILKHYKQTGEILPGTDIIQPDPRFTVKLNPKE